ncbi:inorganic phosphate transporter [Paracoccus sp. PARArs4]|uniref:inorganic phosphate transporter n=1 Tax=Paracoccus sp. PARArs4 TaxID=2853442 RepID=UPI0024A6CEBF|nr:inorganic phosphate transporter [Paracoccus sp. PARArs4]
MKPASSFHTLDKDLRRITNAEAAQQHAFQPVWRLGLAVLVLVAGVILTLSLSGADPEFMAMGAGLIVAGWLGVAIGSNDVANSLGPAVGAGAIRVLPGLLLAAGAGIAGAMLAGGAVTSRLAGGIYDPAGIVAGGQGQIVMVSALIAAATWITLASGIGLPVSTSHSIVGGISGASAAAAGLAGVKWATLGTITVVWVITPLVAGTLAGALLVLLRMRVVDAPDRARAALNWIPAMVALMAALFAAYLARLSLRSDVLIPEIVAAAILGGVAFAITRRKVLAEIARDPRKPSVKRLLRPALVLAVAIMAFAHGANDVGNIAGPLSVIMLGGGISIAGSPLAVLLGGGLAIAAGTLFFGRRLVTLVGSGITRLNAGRAFCVSLGTALTVLTASSLGLPVSTTHVAVGGIFGVGFAREWVDRRRNRRRDALPIEEMRRRVLIRRSHVATITAAWVVTVPVTGALSALVCSLLLAGT